MKSLMTCRTNLFLVFFFLCLGVLGLSLQASAQWDDKPYVYRSYETIDTAYLKCEYRYAFVDSGKTDAHLMVLLVGNKAQQFQGFLSRLTKWDVLGLSPTRPFLDLPHTSYRL